MIDIKVPLLANKDTLSLNILAKVGSDVVWDRKGNSLTRGFVEAIRRYMYREDYTSASIPFPYEIAGQPEEANLAIRYYDFASTHQWWGIDHTYIGWITDALDNGSGEIRLQHTSGFTVSSENWVYISGVEGVTGVNGFWKITRVDPTHIDLQNSVWPGGTFVDAGARVRATIRSSPNSTSNSILRSGLSDDPASFPAGFLVGRDSRAVSIGDNFIYDLIHNGSDRGMLQYGTSNRTPPAQVGPQVELTETRSFVNNNATFAVTIRELGLCASFPFDSSTGELAYILARDIVNIEIVPSASVAITYRVRTQTPIEGGFTRQFLELFYREFANVQREVKDVLNNNWTDGINSDQFVLNSIVGEDSNLPFAASMMLGPVVGTSVKDVEPADYKLRNADDTDSIIVHGTGAGQLFHNRGCTVTEVSIVGNKCSFDVVRMFENRSGGDITVNEVGLYSRNMGASGSPTSSVPLCIARHRVNPGVVVPNGQVLRLTYEVGAEITP